MLNASFCGVDQITGAQAVELQDRTMVLYGNPITTIDHTTASWAYHDELTKIPTWLRTLEKVTVVNLEFCDVMELRAGAFPIALDHLYIKNQRSGLRLHPDSFEGLPNLYYLDISTNEITEGDMHPGLFGGLTNLGFLYMYGNTEVRNFNAEELFPGGTDLGFLNAKQCGLTAIGGDSGINLRGMRGLDVLDLSENDFADRIEADAFDGLASLSDISLTYCGITLIEPDAFSGLTNLHTLDLRRMPHLGLLPQGLFATTCNLQVLYLDDTPYDAFLDNTFSGWGFCTGIFAADETVRLRELCEAQVAVGIEGSCFTADCDEGLCDVCASQSSCESKAWCSWAGDGEDAGRCSDPLRAPDSMTFYECARFCSVEVEGAAVPCLETEEDFTVLESRSRGSNSWVGFMRAEEGGWEFIWVDES
jgi:hypothetical protein